MCVIGWQAAMATTAFAATQQLQGLIALNSPSYIIKGWQSTLFAVAITAFAILWNTVFMRKLPLIEGIGLTLHVFGFFAFVVVLWVMGPRSDTKTVWTNFEDKSGWGNKGVATLVGILGPIVTLIGSDSSCHLSEEVSDAAWVLPRAMVATALVNYTLGFIMTVTVMSTLGNDIDGVLTTPLGQPWIQVLLNATESRVAASIMTALLCLLLLFCAVNQITTSSRQLFAFARDKGLPFSDFLAEVYYITRPLELSLANTLLGPSWLGCPSKCSRDNTTFHDTPMSDYHWLYYRLQRHHLTWTGRPHLILPHCNRLYFRKACSWRTPSSKPFQSWTSRNRGQRNRSRIFIGSVHLLFLPQCSESNSRRDELELPHLRIHLVFLTWLLLCLRKT
jgi:hypothetical protein